jgi:hypothetical protein
MPEESILIENSAEAARLARARERHRTGDDLIRAIYEKRAPWAAGQTAHQEKMRAAFATVREDPFALQAWQRLLHHLGHRSRLLSVEPVFAYLGPQAGNTFLDALLLLALRYGSWLQPPETWAPPAPDETDSRAQFAGLARHLLARYPRPPIFRRGLV